MENTQLQLLVSEQPNIAQLCLVNMPHGSTIEEAQRVALREISNYELILSMRPELQACDPKSVVMAVKACIADNLTLAPNAGLVYLFPGKVLVKVEGSNKIYKDVLQYDPSPEGRLSIAYQAGTILDHKRPEYTWNEAGQVESVSCEFLVPSHPEPRWDRVTYGREFFAKLQAKSAAKYGGKANVSYTSHNGGIDPEFAFAKLIRHGLKKRGTNMNATRRPAPIIPQIIDPKKGLEEAHEYTAFEEQPNTSDNDFTTGL